MDQTDMAYQTALTLRKTPVGLITPYQTDYAIYVIFFQSM